MADSFLAHPGQCWRLVREADPGKLGRVTACKQVVRWVGCFRQPDGRLVRVWSCEEHRDGIELLRSVE